jgi:catechol 2,3-dioxygenase-like lactoylglutathione lyase family enzyme/DNA-binding CsgD family transcriptional regulator
MTNTRGRPPHGDVLTPGEWAVIEFVRHGLSNRAIAERQGVSMDAVKFHVANALGKLGMANRKELRRWNGVRIDSALKGKEQAMGGDAQLGPVGQVSRMVSEIEAAVEWYRDVLGLKHLFTAGEMAFFDCGGLRLYLQQGQRDEAPKPESILYFRVADIHAAHGALEAKGVTFLAAPHRVHRHEDGTEEWMAFLEDPDGRPLGLMANASAA